MSERPKDDVTYAWLRRKLPAEVLRLVYPHLHATFTTVTSDKEGFGPLFRRYNRVAVGRGLSDGQQNNIDRSHSDTTRMSPSCAMALLLWEDVIAHSKGLEWSYLAYRAHDAESKRVPEVLDQWAKTGLCNGKPTQALVFHIHSWLPSAVQQAVFRALRSPERGKDGGVLIVLAEENAPLPSLIAMLASGGAVSAEVPKFDFVRGKENLSPEVMTRVLYRLLIDSDREGVHEVVDEAREGYNNMLRLSEAAYVILADRLDEVLEKIMEMEMQELATERQKMTVEGMVNELLKEFDLNLPSITISTKYVNEQLIERFVRPLRMVFNANTRIRVQFPKGMLLVDESGWIAKTQLETVLKEFPFLSVFNVKSTDVYSKYLGDSEASIRKIFAEARKHSYSVIVFEDFGSLAVKREFTSSESTGGVEERLMSTLLNEMDGISSNSQVVTIGISAVPPSKIDEAVIRSGRLDHHIVF
eukprot:Clim_evm9s198 gene=Clim_evmTU9s198